MTRYLQNSSSIWKLSNTQLKDPGVKEEITMEIRKYFKFNDNKNMTTKFVHHGCTNFKGNYITLNAYIRK